MTRRLYIILCLLALMPLVLSAQQIRVEGFERLKNPLLAPRTYSVDKEHATLDLYTQESGFEFSLGMQPIQAVEGDGMLTLLLPDKTTFFTIKHADYGVLTWKVPGGVLRRKKHYKAQLLTESPKKEFTISKQWVVVHVEPSCAIVTIDSTTHRTMTGKVQAFLPIGHHSISVEAPFHKEFTDSFTLSDSARLDKHIRLQPQFAYLEVISQIPDAEIRIDGHLIGRGMAKSGRLEAGEHELALHRGALCLHKSRIYLPSAERRILTIDKCGKTVNENSSQQQAWDYDLLAEEPQQQQPDTFRIQAFDDSTEIWVDRELVGYGSWKEKLSPGVYAVSTRKDGKESSTQYIHAGKDGSKVLKTPSPYASYGWLNVSCNIVDAEVWLDNKLVGRTPCILQPQSTERRYTLKVSKKGYKSKEMVVTLHGNDMKDINVTLVKR